MPRDEIDGIKTKRGRVVYNRKPSVWTIRDFTRILKKFRSEPVFVSRGSVCDQYAGFFGEAVGAIDFAIASAQSAGCDTEVEATVQVLLNLVKKYQDEEVEFGGGDFGGGGATRNL